MRAFLHLLRQWEFSLSAFLALVTGLAAIYLFHFGDVGLAGLCAFHCAGFLWCCQGFGRVGTVHLRLEDQGN